MRLTVVQRGLGLLRVFGAKASPQPTAGIITHMDLFPHLGPSLVWHNNACAPKPCSPPGCARAPLCLATPYSPSALFYVGVAMGRNCLIYCLADYAIVAASDAETGDTWAGATEALKNSWLPVFVLESG